MMLWYFARATGFVALFAFTAATALGALGSARPSSSTPQRLNRRYLRQMAHRSAAITGLVAIVVHVVLIVLDSFVSVSLPSVFIAFTSVWNPLAVGLGTLAMYAIAAAAISGAMRGRLAVSQKASNRWRGVHLTAYAGWMLAMGHGFLAGTDTGQAWATAIYVGCGLVVAGALSVRLHSRGNQSRGFRTAQPPATPRGIGARRYS